MKKSTPNSITKYFTPNLFFLKLHRIQKKSHTKLKAHKPNKIFFSPNQKKLKSLQKIRNILHQMGLLGFRSF